MTSKSRLENHILEWRSYVERHRIIESQEIDELEDHLRSQIATLADAGLDDDEAFLVAAKRMGDLDSISREFAQEYSERLWKSLVLSTNTNQKLSSLNRDTLVAIGLAIAAGIAIKIPSLFGYKFDGLPVESLIYTRNFSLFVLPFLAIYFVLKRDLDLINRVRLAAPFVFGFIIINILPFRGEGNTVMLAAIHLPIALWFAVGLAYTNLQWRDMKQRMNYIRFTGEWFIYYVLIALGGGVFMMSIMFIFQSIGINAESIVQQWIAPCGIMGAVIISAWLVEAKQNIIENMAPVLTNIFTPLFTLLFVVFLMTVIVTGSSIHIQRESLIGFDLLLALVLGLILFSISVRNPGASPNFFDAMQLLLVASALVVDILALIAITYRISEFGFSPNKVAALGENIILLMNLSWTAVLYFRFLTKRAQFVIIERWQMLYLPVYVIWAWVVVVVIPIVFKFQ